MKDKVLIDIETKVKNGDRITTDEGLHLYLNADLGFLGTLSNLIRERKHGGNTYYNRNFHIEPTNVCVFSCSFCSYSRQYKNKEEGWELSSKQMMDIVKSYDGKPVTEVHIVGGVHPKMNLDFFCELVRDIKAHRPDLHIKGFTAVELDYMFRKAGLTTVQGLSKLKQSGLQSLPGGGAEIFAPEVRSKICDDKIDGKGWLAIHETAHQLGIPSNATMLYGHIEKYEHRIDHMDKLRLLQDKTSGFNTFIPLKFRNQNNDMSDLKESSVVEDLKNYAVSRIFLDNFSHIKAYWPMIGKNTAQMSLSFGVNDVDGTIDDSTKIYSMAGAEDQNPKMTTTELRTLISSAGRIPVERDTLYNHIPETEKVSLA